MASLNRRQFVRFSMLGIGSAVVSTGLTACTSSIKSSDSGQAKGHFEHGVASGDPLSDRVILWTRLTPAPEDKKKTLSISWEMATDLHFKNLVTNGTGSTSHQRDFTFKVDAQQLKPDTTYYYRFQSGENTSITGTTKTLPVGSPDKVKLLVMSCSNYPSGYFNVYKEASLVSDVDVALHLGDYIYEYACDDYDGQDARKMNREVIPDCKLLTLSDYRQRYGHYRTDEDLKTLHKVFPFIVVWDDHEFANNAWRYGAENHHDDEGDFCDRVDQALQAYMEWMPVRTTANGAYQLTDIQRRFQFGDLVNLNMLDTRIIGRDEQIAMDRLEDPTVQAQLNSSSRSLLGKEQRNTLKKTLASNSARWQVLGQQVLMGEIKLPAAVSRYLDDKACEITAYRENTLSIKEFNELSQLQTLAERSPKAFAALSKTQRQLFNNKSHLLQLPRTPYNLDAWDGYPAERDRVLACAAQYHNNLIVIAGDTHNAWANELLYNGKSAGVEFATSSVSSPGMENFLSLDTHEKILNTEQFMVEQIAPLKYANYSNRGFLAVTFTQEKAIAEWTHIDTVKDRNYKVLPERSRKLVVNAESNTITETTA